MNDNIQTTTCSDLDNKEILQELSKRYNDEPRARNLLGKIRFPREHIPEFNSSDSFWRVICNNIERGRIKGGPYVLFAAAADDFPYNSHFIQWRNQSSAPENRNTPHVVISVTGHNEPLELLNLAQNMATNVLGIPG
ncbi:hypothetical protein THIOM_000595, partial [Candidatus Thiomargarita nelsonii]